jgi:hypothetical protein
MGAAAGTKQALRTVSYKCTTTNAELGTSSTSLGNASASMLRTTPNLGLHAQHSARRGRERQAGAQQAPGQRTTHAAGVPREACKGRAVGPTCPTPSSSHPCAWHGTRPGSRRRRRRRRRHCRPPLCRRPGAHRPVAVHTHAPNKREGFPAQSLRFADGTCRSATSASAAWLQHGSNAGCVPRTPH